MLTLPGPETLLAGAMAFLRIGGILFALPVIGDEPTPLRVRILLSLAITVGLFPVIPASWNPSLDVDAWKIGFYIVKEISIGLLIGMLARVAFAGMLMAASIVSYQMGFGTSNLFMPGMDGQLDSFTAFHRIVMMLIFLALDMHHVFLGAIHETFLVIPGGMMELKTGIGTMLVGVTASVFSVALQLAAPVLIALMFTMAALGLVARTVPQMNVFILSFPASFFIGLAVYLATFPFYPQWMREHFFETQDQVLAAIRGMAS